MAEFVPPRGGGYSFFRGGTERGKGANQRFESGSYFSRGIHLKAQAVTVKLLSVKIYLATCLRKLLPDLFSAHCRTWEEKQAAVSHCISHFQERKSLSCERRETANELDFISRRVKVIPWGQSLCSFRSGIKFNVQSHVILICALALVADLPASVIRKR